MNAWFLAGAFAIWRRDEGQAEADGYRVEKRVFRFSLFYLFLHFGALAGRGDAAVLRTGALVMAIKAEHEIHQRRFGRNLGVGLVLAGFVVLMFALSVVKIKQLGAVQGFDHVVRPEMIESAQ